MRNHKNSYKVVVVYRRRVPWEGIVTKTKTGMLSIVSQGMQDKTYTLIK